MLWFAIGLFVFFAIHHLRQIAPVIREKGVARFGQQGWKGIYSLVSLLGLALIIMGWWVGRLDAPEVYKPPVWGRHATALLVLLAFILLAAANLHAGRIKQWVRHPMSVGIILWSIGHLLANGDAFSLSLWGAFLLSSVWHIVAAEQRGDAPPRAVDWRGDVGGVLIGILAYGIFAFWLHGMLFGVIPF